VVTDVAVAIKAYK